MKLKRLTNWILLLVVLPLIPIPDKLNIEVDSHRATVEDKVWYFSMYGILCLSFYIIYKLSSRFIFQVLFLLAIGKLVDQIFNPYGYHLAEMAWDIIILAWIIHRKCRKYP